MWLKQNKWNQKEFTVQKKYVVKRTWDARREGRKEKDGMLRPFFSNKKVCKNKCSKADLGRKEAYGIL
jgi:hypothetical protein